MKMKLDIVINPFKRMIRWVDRKRRWLMDPTQNPRRWVSLGRPAFVAAFFITYIQWEKVGGWLMFVCAIAALIYTGWSYVQNRRNLRKVARFATTDDGTQNLVEKIKSDVPSKK